jgi:hypothetical protein
MKTKKPWTVKAHGIQAVRLCYLSWKEFKVLRKLRDGFVGRLLGERKGLGEAKTPPHSKNPWFRSPVRDVLDPARTNPSSSYQATRMWHTRESAFWNWRGVKEYWDQMTEVHGIMAT